jgi:catechol 2,3-dioxygenase-like lactoylglutathione lyase family enzyme
VAPRALALHHWGITVTDLEASRRWYERLGLVPGIGSRGAGRMIERVVEVPGARMETLFMEAGDAAIELIEYHEPQRAAAEPLGPAEVGAGRVVLRAPGLDSENRLVDPDGYVIELRAGSALGLESGGRVVPDLDAAVAWYADALGLTPEPGGDGRTAKLRVGPHRLVLEAADRAAVSGAAPRNDRIGANHPCFLVAGIEAVAERLLASGGSAGTSVLPAVPELPGWRVLYFRDPAGIQCEMLCPPEAEETPADRTATAVHRTNG